MKSIRISKNLKPNHQAYLSKYSIQVGVKHSKNKNPETIKQLESSVMISRRNNIEHNWLPLISTPKPLLNKREQCVINMLAMVGKPKYSIMISWIFRSGSKKNLLLPSKIQWSDRQEKIYSSIFLSGAKFTAPSVKK